MRLTLVPLAGTKTSPTRRRASPTFLLQDPHNRIFLPPLCHRKELDLVNAREVQLDVTDTLDAKLDLADTREVQLDLTY